LSASAADGIVETVGFGDYNRVNFERLGAEIDAAQRRDSARQAGEALRDSLADLRRQSSEHGGRTAAALEALLELTEREAERSDERERTMLKLTRRNVWISATATVGTLTSVAVAIVATFGS
jgi:hypothetical protein